MAEDSTPFVKDRSTFIFRAKHSKKGSCAVCYTGTDNGLAKGQRKW